MEDTEEPMNLNVWQQVKAYGHGLRFSRKIRSCSQRRWPNRPARQKCPLAFAGPPETSCSRCAKTEPPSRKTLLLFQRFQPRLTNAFTTVPPIYLTIIKTESAKCACESDLIRVSRRDSQQKTKKSVISFLSVPHPTSYTLLLTFSPEIDRQDAMNR